MSSRPPTGPNDEGNGHAEYEMPIEDRSVGFTLPGRNARGRIVRLGPVLDAILSNHGYPPPLAALLAEALTLTALLGATLKDQQGQMTLQAQAQDGLVDLLVCDYLDGALRGYVRHDPARVADLSGTPDLGALFGTGYLAITFDQTVSKERYQGIVPLEGASLSAAVQNYFDQSEQIPSLVRFGVVDRGLAGHSAGGLLLQHLPEGETGRERLHVRHNHPDWEHVAALAATVADDELTDPALPLTTVLWRLFHEDETRIIADRPLTRGCRCSLPHIREVIGRFPEEDRADMRDAEGKIHVDCAFCAKSFLIEM